MYFLENTYLRGIERMMRSVPDFAQRGRGVMTLDKHEYTAEDCGCRYCLYYNGRGKKAACGLEHCVCLEERIRVGVAARREIMTEAMYAIRYPPFRNRLNEYIKESEETPMDYRNEKHKTAFMEAIGKRNKKDYALMSAIYLLTAEPALWTEAKHQAAQNDICFDRIRLQNSTENAYTLFCCAKDLYLGSKHITVKDLADKDLIAPRIFGLICNAMSIRRFGLGAINFTLERKQNHDPSSH